MSIFKSKKHYLREVLLYFFGMKKYAVKSYRLLLEAYGKAALSQTMCCDWFRCLKSNDFDVEGKECAERPKLVEDAELEALFDEDPYQTQFAESFGVAQSIISMCLKALGIIQKQKIEYCMN